MARRSAGARRWAGAGALRQRVLQVAFVVAGVLAVAVADRTADRLLVLDAGLNAQRLAAALALSGRVAGGWALGMAFRLQFTRATAVDRQARVLLGIPACLVAAWPVTSTFLPQGLLGALPWWATGGGLAGVAPFLAVVLGLVLSLGVTAGRPRQG